MTPIKHMIASRPSSDGDGVKIKRLSLFNQQLTDPFLMLDELGSDNPNDYIGGFPPHPHRGMETLTYLRHGSLTHKDHLGNTGLINSGGVQWMSAGKGIIHSEMPARELDRLHGFQLWINLPAAEKMSAPQYRDVPMEEVVHVQLENGTQLHVIAGDWQIDGIEHSGPLSTLAANAHYLDIELPAGAELTLPVKRDHQVMAYVYEGQLLTQPTSHAGHLLIFDHQGEVQLKAEQDSSILLLTGRPLREPVVHYGPFVMNSVEQIEQAIQDYNAGRFGQL
ncbi:MAG: pirin family protein [Bacterioplanes sp.]|nr:pirin family protein [Bacterioplanes sp.]